MTTNHPAHGPVSLDRLHQIRQYIEHNTQYSNGGNRAYILADVLKVIDGAIAAFGADPISQCDSRKQFEEHFGDGATPGMERVPPFFVEMMKDAFWTVWEGSRASMLQAGNSPVIGIDLASEPDRSVEVRYLAPPGYVMVPKEPTNEMLNAWLSEIANWRGHVAGYKAMLAAAPLQAEEPAQKSRPLRCLY